MTTVFSLCIWLLTLYLVPFLGLMAFVTISAYRARRLDHSHPAIHSPTSCPRILIVIPAHNEETHIEATIASCKQSTYDPACFEVWVIADNCADATATTARQAGARVFERVDDLRRSKGYAIEDFLEQCKVVSPESSRSRYSFDAIVVVDADTLIDSSLVSSVATSLRRGDDWLQCYYTVRNPDVSWRTRLLTYAFSLFNGVWLLGQDRLGIGAGFRGNGMAFSAAGLSRVPWRAYGLVEDQEFSWVLRVTGERVRFLADARVFGEMVSKGRGAVTQRRRWEDGRRALRRKFLHPILNSTRLSRFHKALALIDLFMPPLVPLLGMFLVALLSSLIPGIVSGRSILRLILSIMGLTFTAYALSPFVLMALPVRYLASILNIPYYATWKLLTSLRSGTSAWVRTEREPVSTK